MRQLSRRDLFALSGALGGGMLLPRKLWATSGVGQRKFLFVFCPGGWDQVQVFAPVFADGVDREQECEEATVNGITFVDTDQRPEVRSFFETWGGQTCLINGMQVRSVAHEICRRLVMTGSSQPNVDCWPSLLGATAAGDLPMPNLHVSGPIFPYLYPNATVRVGSKGQLVSLLDGGSLQEADAPISALSSDIEALENSYVSARADAFALARARSRAAEIASGERSALSRMAALSQIASDLEFDTGGALSERAAVIAECMQRGLSRCGVVAYEGYLDMGWDSHASNFFQSPHFTGLFSGLDEILTDLSTRPGEVESTLLEETTVVVLSEMGRAPSLNSSKGKEHWTWTSAMLLGAGVRGGQTIGAWTDLVTGESVNLDSGEVDDEGETILPTHLGATLLALADVDPSDYMTEGTPIAAAIL